MNEMKRINEAPWLLSSWQTDMESWIESILEKLNEKVVGELEQVKVSELCNVQKVPTTTGNVYFKAVSPQLRFEAELSRHLYRKYPKKCAEVFGIDAQKGWLLLKDIKGKALRELKDRALWQRAIGEYAALQIQEIGNVELFLSIGVTDRRLPVLKKEIEENLEAMCGTGLNEEETTAVLVLKNELIEMCDELNGTLPDTIEHGDLHSANMRLVDGEIVFFDWGDASVTHPFLSTRVF